MAVVEKRAEHAAPGFGPTRFMREVYDELRKVVWPTGAELYRYTVVVIVTVAILGLFIGGADYLLGAFAQRTLYHGAG